MLAAALIETQKGRALVQYRLTGNTSPHATKRFPTGLRYRIAALREPRAGEHLRTRAHQRALHAVFDLFLYTAVRRPSICHITTSRNRTTMS
jgi:hypothetical protein